MIPDAKFFLTSGKKQSTGIIEMMIAASEMVFADGRSISSGGIPSVIEEVWIALSRKYCKVCKFSLFV